MSQEYTDRLALEVALQVHRSAGAKQTFLFGSRARGDHRPDSDIDVLVITAAAQPDGWLERLCRAGGVDPMDAAGAIPDDFWAESWTHAAKAAGIRRRDPLL